MPWTINTGKDLDGTRICNALDSVYQKFKPENHKLRVLCCDALDPDGYMSEVTATEVLQYFLKTIKAFEEEPGTCIDLMCMPSIKMDSPHPGKLVELLWELRKNVVMISGVKIDAVLGKSPVSSTEVNILHIGTEVITVGADLEISPETRPALLAADVKVRPDDNSKWLPAEKSHLDALGTVAAICVLMMENINIKELRSQGLYSYNWRKVKTSSLFFANPG